MTAYDWNKIIGAILGTLVVVMGIGFIAEAIYAPKEETGGGYALATPEAGGEQAAATNAAAAPAATPLPVLLASADAAAGAKAAKKCAACHDLTQSNTNKTGPGLWNIVGRKIAAHPGFSYSDALIKLAETEGSWSYANLDAFVHKPKDVAPGTKMGFAGIKSEKERANVLAFLQTLSDNPVPFPQPLAQKAEGTPVPDQTVAPPANPADAQAAANDATGQQTAPAAATNGAAGAGAGDQTATLLANANPENGAKVAKKCAACHDFSKANNNKVGPGLWGIVGKPIAAHPDYAYSDALKKLAESEGNWTYQNLDAFIHKPRDAAPGTKMGFPGISKDKDRADLLAYLGTLSDNPSPVPAPTADSATAPVAAPQGQAQTNTDNTAAPAAPASEAAPAEPTSNAAPAAPTAVAGAGNGQMSAIAQAVANANPEAGARVAKKCAACHDFSKASNNKVGPGLWDIVGKQIAAHPDYAYSDALKKLAAEEGTWTFDNLDAFIHKPRDAAPGTKMGFPGISKDKDRADLLAYLATLSDNPAPVPVPTADSATTPAQ